MFLDQYICSLNASTSKSNTALKTNQLMKVVKNSLFFFDVFHDIFKLDTRNKDSISWKVAKCKIACHLKYVLSMQTLTISKIMQIKQEKIESLRMTVDTEFFLLYFKVCMVYVKFCF